MLPWLIVLGIVLVLGVTVAVGYNSLVRGRVRLQEAWAQIDTQLKRRHDLIPMLVETVKAYAAHEQETLDALTRARASAMHAETSRDPDRVGAAESRLSSSLDTVFGVAEAYPDLKAATSFLQLQQELVATENKIAYARHFYNTSVRDYNIAVQTMPRSILAGAMKLESARYLEIEAGDRAATPIDMPRNRRQLESGGPDV